jgi:hypothetical protein
MDKQGLSAHKHSDNAASNANSEKQNGGKFCGEAWVRGAKEDELSTGRVRAAGFQHVTARSRLASVLKFMNRLFV